MFKKYNKVLKEDYEKWYAEHESDREETAKDPMRLKFHLMPKTGWLNDPNGLCQFHGTYHIYYQYTPFEPTGELKLWGHYTTKDFVSYIEDVYKRQRPLSFSMQAAEMPWIRRRCAML